MQNFFPHIDLEYYVFLDLTKNLSLTLMSGVTAYVFSRASPSMGKVSSDRDSGLTVLWRILAAYFCRIFSVSEELLFFFLFVISKRQDLPLFHPLQHVGSNSEDQAIMWINLKFS